tara:strand:+ start:179 stop:958 length:780 start_codon:yes stop_codon:yes gene_type:complete
MKLNKIYNENCLDTMQKMEQKKIDCILTSPPYNTSRKGSSLKKASASVRYDEFNDCKTDNEYINWTLNIFNSYNKVLKENGIIIYNLSYSSENTHLMWLVISEIINKTQFTIADCIIWKKPTTTPNNTSPNKLTRIIEYVFIICRKNEIDSFQCNKEISSITKSGQKIYKNYFNFIEAPNNDGSNNIHKATFSTDLVRKLIKLYVKKNEIVYDSFIGTGTTAIACIMEDVNYIGSELSRRYVDYSNKRIEQHKSQLTMF